MPDLLKVLAKKCLPSDILLLVIVCLCLNVSAQHQTINKNASRTKSQVRMVSSGDQDFDVKELEKLKSNAVKKLEQSKYRSTQTTEKFDGQDSPYNFSNKIITEFVPPGSEHYIRESTSRGKKSRYENYSIGDKTYLLQENGSWKMTVSSGKAPSVNIGGGDAKGAGGPSGSAEESKPQASYKLTKGQTVNGRKADLYTVTESSMRKTSSAEESTVETDSYWFDQNGFIIKTEFSSAYKNKSFNTSFSIVTNYEYDEKIKIVPPDIDK